MLRTIMRGHTGPDVLAIQDALKIRAPGLALVSDGQFGSNTQAAVVAFQSKNRLKPDGIVGPRTRSVLYPLVATTINLVGTKSTGGTGAAPRLPSLIPRQATLGILLAPRVPQGLRASALSPPAGPQLKLDSFQLNPGAQVSFANLAQSPQASFSLGMQSVFKRGEDDGRLELALGVQVGSPLFLRGQRRLVLELLMVRELHLGRSARQGRAVPPLVALRDRWRTSRRHAGVLGSRRVPDQPEPRHHPGSAEYFRQQRPRRYVRPARHGLHLGGSNHVRRGRNPPVVLILARAAGSSGLQGRRAGRPPAQR